MTTNDLFWAWACLMAFGAGYFRGRTVEARKCTQLLRDMRDRLR